MVLNSDSYHTPQICKALHVTRMTLYLWEQKGMFVSPRDYRGRRVMNKKQLNQLKKSIRRYHGGQWIYEG